jgi:hypothetical protein
MPAGRRWSIGGKHKAESGKQGVRSGRGCLWRWWRPGRKSTPCRGSPKPEGRRPPPGRNSWITGGAATVLRAGAGIDGGRARGVPAALCLKGGALHGGGGGHAADGAGGRLPDTACLGRLPPARISSAVRGDFGRGCLSLSSRACNGPGRCSSRTALGPGVAVGVQCHASDFQPLTPLLEFRGTVAGADGAQVGKKRTGLGAGRRWRMAATHRQSGSERA